jgi:predicted Zn-dependent protease with MMP-like domain
MTDAEFRACLEAALAELPTEIRGVIEERCTIVVEDFPADELVREGLDPLSLGLLTGADLSEQATGEEEVVLYKKNLEKVADTREELVDEIRTTLRHEVGHALGFDEEGVDDLGLA